LASVADAISKARQSSETYGETLAGADKQLNQGLDAAALRQTVDALAGATRRVQRENASLEKKLADSSAEVARLRDHLEQVRRDATTDALTNLANRKAFDDELGRGCAEAAEKGEPLSLAVIDIDHFKQFNDTWGHQTGDQVIRYVSSVIGRLAPPPRFAARYGGEEFAMIFPRERTGDVIGALEEIRAEVSSRVLKRRSTNEDLGTVTVSIGLAELRANETAEGLIERADAALYASKRTGRNRVTSAPAIVAAA
jgi:diguanylate cyclase